MSPEPVTEPAPRPVRRWPSVLGLASLAAVCVACTAAAGAGVLGVAVGAGALAGACYDHIDVSVYDTARGARICDARVFALEGEQRTEFRSCYHAALGEGHYRLVVERVGYAPQSTELVVEHPEGCPHRVGTVRFDLAPPPASAPVAAPRPPSEAARPSSVPEPGASLDAAPPAPVPPQPAEAGPPQPAEAGQAGAAPTSAFAPVPPDGARDAGTADSAAIPAAGAGTPDAGDRGDAAALDGAAR